MKRATAAASLAALLFACNLSTPTLEVPMAIEWAGEFKVSVFDSSGLVIGGRDVNRSPYPFGETARAHPETSEIELVWIGGACTHRPTLTVSGTTDALHLTVDSPSDSTIPFVEIACPLIGLPFGITLELSQPVEQQAITTEFN
jgi:hypothetical protein